MVRIFEDANVTKIQLSKTELSRLDKAAAVLRTLARYETKIDVNALIATLAALGLKYADYYSDSRQCELPFPEGGYEAAEVSQSKPSQELAPVEPAGKAAS